MSMKKRLLSLVLTVAMVLAIVPWTGIGVAAAFTGALQFDANGKFTVLQVADIQESSTLNSRVLALLQNAIARYSPDLAVFTGDNQTGGSLAYKGVIDKIVAPFNDSGTKFAVTFGNHDDEAGVSKQTQYDYYKSKGGNNFIDHDISALDGVGSGVIPIYPNGQTSGTPAFQVYPMDSGSDASSGYDCPYTSQIDYYINRSITYPNVPSLWYMHIIVPDVFYETMTTTNNGTTGRSGNGSAFGSSTYYLQADKINWTKSGQATTIAEFYKELPCPANPATYTSTAHRSSSTYGSKTLYESWVAYGNMLGTYYGHDHQNSFVTTTQHGIDIGFGKAPTLKSYNDGNPGLRIFELDIDGTYSSYNITEADLTKAQIFFNDNGGTGEMIPQFITKSSTAALKTNTYTKSGTAFMGWATSPTGSVVYTNGANYSIGTSDVTLYAKWGVTSNITFNAGGGSGGTGPTAMEVGMALNAPTVTKTGYTLSSWSPSVPATVPASNTTYTAQWTPNTYTVNYSGNGSSSGSTASSTHTYDAAKNLTANGFSRVGYNYLGWSTSSSATTATYTNAQSVTNLTATAGGVVTFYAVWQIAMFTITFNANEGSGGTSGQKTYGTALTAPAVTRQGYTFNGWLPLVPATVPGYNETYVAQWTQNSYNITFNANGGTGGNSASVLYGVMPSAPTVTKEGHTFAGWDPPITAATEPKTYTAQWNTSSYSIIFDANGGEGGTGGTMTFGTTLSAPTVTRVGYTFAGWTPIVPPTVPAINTTYTAQWNPINYYITFNANGGTGGTSGQMPFDAELTAPEVARAGYTFMGWSPEVPSTVPAIDSTYTAQWAVSTNNLIFGSNGGTGGTGTMLPFGSTITPPAMSRPGYLFTGWSPALPSTVVGGINTYQAQWVINRFMVTFDAAGGTGGTSGTYQFGMHLSAPAVTRAGYTFTGWSPTVPTSVPGQNTTYTAQWTRDKIQVTFDANSGTGGTSSLLTFGDSLTPPVVGRPGYIFTGWSPAVPSKVVAGNQTYTAQWMAVN